MTPREAKTPITLPGDGALGNVATWPVCDSRDYAASTLDLQDAFLRRRTCVAPALRELLANLAFGEVRA